MPAIAVLFLLFLAGCARQPGTGTVRGRVTAGGEPVADGSVLLAADAPKWATIAMLDADGRYTATGVPVGVVRVGVRGRGLKRFENPAASGLEYQVFPGEQTIDIALPAD